MLEDKVLCTKVLIIHEMAKECNLSFLHVGF